MDYFNCCIYEVDLKGTTDSSFKGPHPSIIIQTLKEPTVFYIIPLTSYTKEKWEKLRKFNCCKIDSVNSIARIDKMQIRESVDIPKRYFKEGKTIVPTADELCNVLEKAKQYFYLSSEKALKHYKKYYTEYVLFESEWKKFLLSNSIQDTHFTLTKSDSGLLLEYPSKTIKNLPIEDIRSILKNSVYFFKITYTKDKEKMQIILSQKP